MANRNTHCPLSGKMPAFLGAPLRSLTCQVAYFLSGKPHYTLSLRLKGQQCIVPLDTCSGQDTEINSDEDHSLQQ